LAQAFFGNFSRMTGRREISPALGMFEQRDLMTGCVERCVASQARGCHQSA